jgi:hypothetical protein
VLLNTIKDTTRKAPLVLRGAVLCAQHVLQCMWLSAVSAACDIVDMVGSSVFTFTSSSLKTHLNDIAPCLTCTSQSIAKAKSQHHCGPAPHCNGTYGKTQDSSAVHNTTCIVDEHQCNSVVLLATFL